MIIYKDILSKEVDIMYATDKVTKSNTVVTGKS